MIQPDVSVDAALVAGKVPAELFDGLIGLTSLRGEKLIEAMRLNLVEAVPQHVAAARQGVSPSMLSTKLKRLRTTSAVVASLSEFYGPGDPVAGTMANTQFFRLLALTSLRGEQLIAAMRAVLVDDSLQIEAARKYGVSTSMLCTKLKHLREVSDAVAPLAPYYRLDQGSIPSGDTAAAQ
ncbi:PapB/FocB family fimbrial expression transcriptional regulator [Geopseudomonas aromaticivorans]